MNDNIYQAPSSEISINSTGDNQFYVVSAKKFLILYISTLGAYSIYWFYKHWSQFKNKNNENMWPVMRGIFAIFFTHSLFELFNQTCKEQKTKVSWNPGSLATAYVIITIIDNICNQLSFREVGSPITEILPLLTLPITTWLLYKAQQVANIACEDPTGSSNENYTIANFLWITIGIIIWLLTGLGLFAIIYGIE
ncbi:hypothetical protein [Aliikangiella sp. IMCC44359]|uniref:hypothetical protein n=1 Tax=Aliikangiella sp. IMCC44359 TaxID=3459125 RepID=UPI00403AB407